MTEKELLIRQLSSSYDFLHHKWMTTKDPKLSDQYKRELLDAQQQLRRAKNGDH